MTKYLHGNKPQAERAIQNRAQSRVANSVSGGFESEIGRAFKDAARDYARFGSDAVIEGVLQQHNAEMKQLVENTWQRAGKLAGDRTLGALKAYQGATIITKSDRSDFEEIFRGFIMTEALVRSVGLGLTTMAALRTIIRKGKEAGESVDVIASTMVSRGILDSKYRAMMIARTESHAAYNSARQAASEASSLSMSKEWVSASDGRTRDFGDGEFSHAEADGETVGLNEMFVETGESLRFPGDPSGSGANVINCRCATVDVLN